MLPVWSKPLIQYAYEEALSAGIEQFIFVTGRNKNAITNHFDLSYELNEVLNTNQRKTEIDLTTSWLPTAGQLCFIRQQSPLGLGHAIWCARYMIEENEPFAVLLADELLKYPGGFLKEMISTYNDTGGNIIAVTEESKSNISQYGVIKVKDPNPNILEIEGMVEKPKADEAPSNLAIIGRYILSGKIFSLINPEKKGDKEIQLVDSMLELLKSQKFYGLKYHGERFDCGNKLGFLKANIAYALEDPELGNEVKKIIE
jgi:UTP-glucose-1-phosphate uridylyltransferase